MDTAMKIIEVKINLITVQHHPPPPPKTPIQTNHARRIERTFGLT